MTAIVILAAGSSSRMGRPKQNLVYADDTLLNRMIKIARSVSDHVVVVLGANRDEVKANMANDGIDILHNENWISGMGSSIKQAVSHIQFNFPATETILFMVCDQPFVSTELLKDLISAANHSKKGIVACTYEHTNGVPVLFKKKYFPVLLELNGQEGAKHILKKHQADIHAVDFTLGHIDIDTEDDFKRFQNLPEVIFNNATTNK